MCHSQPGGSPGKILGLPKRKETIVSWCVRRGGSFPVCPQKAEHCLNELQRWAQATAISSDPRDGHETLRLLQPPRSLCASTGHYPQPHTWKPVQPATARVPRSRDNFSGGKHGVSQGVATSRQPLPPQAQTAFQL